MAVSIITLFEPQQLTSSIAAYFTAPVPTRIDKLTLSNPTTNARQVSIYWVPRGGAAGPTNQIIANRYLQPNETWDVYPLMGHVLSPGDEIAAVCDSAAAVDFFGSGTAVS